MKTLIEADNQRIARLAGDYVHMRMQLMIGALVAAMEQAGRMQQAGGDAVPFDVEGSGYGFEVIRSLAPEQAELPHSCTMERPPRASS